VCTSMIIVIVIAQAIHKVHQHSAGVLHALLLSILIVGRETYLHNYISVPLDTFP